MLTKIYVIREGTNLVWSEYSGASTERVNPFHAESFLGNIEIYPYFLSLLSTEIVPVLCIWNHGWQGPSYPTQPIPWLLMTWWCKSGYQQPWYSVLPIYRGRVYRGIGYIAVACWTPFFGAQERNIFSRNRGNSLDPIRGRQFFAKFARRDHLCSRSVGNNFSRNQF